MSVPAEVSLAAVRAELAILADYVAAAGLAMDASHLSESRLCFTCDLEIATLKNSRLNFNVLSTRSILPQSNL